MIFIVWRVVLPSMYYYYFHLNKWDLCNIVYSYLSQILHTCMIGSTRESTNLAIFSPQDPKQKQQYIHKFTTSHYCFTIPCVSHLYPTTFQFSRNNFFTHPTTHPEAYHRSFRQRLTPHPPHCWYGKGWYECDSLQPVIVITFLQQ